MKNRTASYLFAILSAWSAGYYTALKIISPGFELSFNDCWLVLAVILFFAFLRIRTRSADKKYVPLAGFPPGIRRTAAITGAVLGAVMLANLFFICTPDISDGTIETKYVIILGGGIRHNGTLTSMPKKRLEKAAEYLAAHPDTKAIVSGGTGRFAPCAEAPVLAENLVAIGIDKSRILQEDKAKDTIQNFSYSAALIAKNEKADIKDVFNEPVTVVTSSFHLARSERIARRIGFRKVYGLAAPVPPIFLLTVYCREICSYIKLNIRILLTGKPAEIS
jgi:uncharacterized SAM-binding protein YcdF (DUF218 family)